MSDAMVKETVACEHALTQRLQWQLAIDRIKQINPSALYTLTG